MKRNPGLEAAIAADPEDPAPYLVYADWLQSQGEPWGELIAVSAAAEGQTDSSSFLALRKAKQALESIRTTLLRPELITAVDAKSTLASLEWRRGFVRQADLANADLLEPLLESPAAIALASLTVRRMDAGALETIARHRLPLAKLVLGNPYARTRVVIRGLERIADLPRLQDLRIDARVEPPGPLRHGALIRLSLDADLAKKHLRALAAWRLPALRTLSIGFQGGKRTLEDVLAVIESDGLPALERLGIFSCVFSPQIAARLPAGPRLAGLKELSFKGGFDFEAAVEALIAHAESYRALEVLDLRGNFLPVALADRLMEALPAAKFDVVSPRRF